ncbi:FAD/NAD(P)-binding protein [Dyella nitratireducens]|uniref:Pyridine nucleotide-disulfide oxidoreductase n=1 Tax=Dyella nitratireducens TaxID=1849580 RepID=A0ABQ1FMJ0_9GAMM|nr:FAD/NAD(P)-binding protein [Dyella nitratireducens]GGA19923.1 pyridine nucleotide-disulfide oxidoreductase [Dyella nitratireducens]GLQ44445.1 pyridine nucleotide-disulfide oxidoreductase [Dyella nitratireducens]
MANIAIIGGGATGASVFGALLAHDAPDTVHWVTGSEGGTGRGVAYGAAHDHHLLNVRASGMGLYLDADDDFAQYSSRHRPGSQPTDFLPRRLFGEYIEAQLSKRLHHAQQRDRHFAIEPFTATRLRATRNGYEITLNNGESVTADHVVLALGALTPRPLRTVSERALASGAYVLDPWSLTQRSIQPRRLTVIGTGLTAVDTLISASIRWPDIELVAVSRHGLLPFVHPALPIAPYPHQAELNAKLMACEGPAPIFAEIRRLFREQQGLDWRSVIDGMRPINARLWQAFTPRQRRQFLRHVRWLWESSRHRLAPEPAEIIQQLRDEGRLHVYAARVLDVDGAGPLNVTLRSRANQVATTLQSDIVVQATGLDTAVAFAEHSLLAGLLKDGLAIADPLNLGVLAQPDGQLINAAGDVQHGLYAIGSLVRGNLWECTAMPEIRVAANALAAQLNTRSVLQPDLATTL